MAYLITGGTGFIGSRIVRDLIGEGEPTVVYDLYPDVSGLNRLLDDKGKGLVKVIQGDINDLAHLIHTVQKNNVKKVIHLAGLLSDSSRENPALALKVNCEGTINIFETARLSGLEKVVWASSMGVFGPADKYTEEYVPNDAPHYPNGVYGACKSFNERIAVHYCESYGLDIIGLRYTLVYGAGQRSGASAALIRELVEKPAMGMPGRVPDGDDSVNWLYVDDAAIATLLAAKTPETRTKAFTVNGDYRALKEVAEYIKTLLPGADITLIPGLSKLSFKYDATPIKEEIGYRPQWSMERGIKETINMVRKQNGLSPV